MPVAKDQAIARAKARGGVVKSAWTGTVRTGEFESFLKGDIIQMPTTFEDEIYENPQLNGAEYIVATVKRGTREFGMDFYPGSLVKSVGVVEADRTIIGYHPVMKKNDKGESTGEQLFMVAEGTAVDLYKSYEGGDLDGQMKLLCGKKIKVSSISPRFSRFNGYQNRISPATVMRFDLVNDKGEVIDGAGNKVSAKASWEK